jgi:phosphoglycolate phosphatase
VNYIFDFDGTLADSFSAMLAVYNKNIRGEENPISPEQIAELRNMTSRKAVRALGVRWWQIPKLLLRGLPEFRKLVPTLKTFNGLPEVIKELSDRGENLFIVTSNTRDSVDEFLKLEGLDGYFTDIVSGAGLFKKAKHIRRLIKTHNLKRKETIYIGDETRDIQAAKLARIKIVSVTWGFNTREILSKQRPVFMVDKPKQLLDLKMQ